MSNERVRQLLTALRAETAQTELDSETRSALRRFDSDIHELLDAPATPDVGGIVEQARLLEARFAADHPAAERFMRDIVDTLVKIGL